ncbi:hypothetical protein OH77DRAFT_1064773 [Trametes cingulata]|nr:hypothetical protein OH77DRAFT_1064773 [Trametes cingulata]
MGRTCVPLEICESVIDHCRSPDVGDGDACVESRDVLRACCLTCQEWLPRARFRLYETLVLQDSDQVNMLLATFTTHPFLADHVHALVIYTPPFTSRYISLARRELTSKLRHLRSLTYCGHEWVYPPTCHWRGIIARYPITKLVLDSHFRRPIDLFRFIWTFEHLEYLGLHLSRPGLRTSWSHAGFARLGQLALASRSPQRRLDLLKVLEITQLINLPPELYSTVFGTSVTDFICTGCYDHPFFESWNGIAARDYLAQLDQLRTLTMCVITTQKHWNRVQADGTSLQSAVLIPRHIISAISACRNHRDLICITVTFGHSTYPNVNDVDDPDDADLDDADHRYALLSRTFGPVLDHILAGIASLRELVVNMEAPYFDGHTSSCWRSWMQDRMPTLKAEIVVNCKPSPYRNRLLRPSRRLQAALNGSLGDGNPTSDLPILLHDS